MRPWLLGEDRLLGGKGMFTVRAAEGQRLLLYGKGEQDSSCHKKVSAVFLPFHCKCT